MASALAWAERDWEVIPDETVDGVTTRGPFVVCTEAASKISSLRDACGGVAVVIKHLRGRVCFPAQPLLDHAVVLLGNEVGEICLRVMRVSDIKRARGLLQARLARGGGTQGVLHDAGLAAAGLRDRRGHLGTTEGKVLVKIVHELEQQWAAGHSSACGRIARCSAALTGRRSRWTPCATRSGA